MRTPKIVVDDLVFPESARWHQGKLWFVDKYAHKVLTYDLDGRTEVMGEFDDKTSGLGFLPDGTPLVVLERKRQILKFQGSRISLHSDLSALPGHRLNDMVVDHLGRAYVGNRSKHKSPSETGANPKSPETVVLVRKNGLARTVAEDMWGPNGSAVTPDGKTLIVAETSGERLTAFDISDDGSLKRRRLFAELGTKPDGICLDVEGAVWVAAVQASEFIRVQEGGRVLERIPVAGKWAVACVLGGPDRRTLFMLTAHNSIENSNRMVNFADDFTSDSEGFVEVMQVQVPGAGLP